MTFDLTNPAKKSKRNRVLVVSGPGKRGAFNRSMQHHLTVGLKGGVYDRTETNETFSHGEERDLGALEGRAVHA